MFHRVYRRGQRGSGCRAESVEQIRGPTTTTIAIQRPYGLTVVRHTKTGQLKLPRFILRSTVQIRNCLPRISVCATYRSLGHSPNQSYSALATPSEHGMSL